MTEAVHSDTDPEIEAETDVVIVGGGPVGLALAIELGLRGIRTILIEKEHRTGSAPRAKTTHVRTMEHMRRWGIAEKVRQAAPLPADYPTDVIFTTSLFGIELAKFENAFYGARVKDPRFSEPAQWIPQYKVEAVLLARAAGLASNELRFGFALVGLDQTADRVVVRIKDVKTGRETKLAAAYVVGADGSRSETRKALGIAMQGESALGRHFNAVLRIPEFGDTPPPARAIMYFIVNPRIGGGLGPMDVDNLWFLGLHLAPDEPEPGEAEIRSKLLAAVGKPVAFEILSTDLWSAHRLIANSYRRGRVFLAGDACHLHPPFGGYGMNMGIADAVDLGWKLAAALQGWGTNGLLDSYEAERRPVHLRVLREAVQNHAVLSHHFVNDRLEDPTETGDAARAAVREQILQSKVREFDTLGVVLGSHYSGSPVVVADGTSPPADDYRHYQPSAHPGCLAPHLWLEDGSSLYDHFGPGFTLLVIDRQCLAAADRLLASARAIGLPLQTVCIDDPRLGDLYAAGLALIRPDQYVAWRGSDGDARTILDTVRGGADASLARFEAGSLPAMA